MVLMRVAAGAVLLGVLAACGQVEQGGGEVVPAPSPSRAEGPDAVGASDEAQPAGPRKPARGTDADEAQGADDARDVASADEVTGDQGGESEIGAVDAASEAEASTEGPGAAVNQEPTDGSGDGDRGAMVQQPAAGMYGFELTGSRQTPLDAAPHEYEDDGWLEVEVSNRRDVAVLERRSSEDDAVQMMALRWGPDAVVVERQRTEIPDVGVYECRVDPPLVFVSVPLRAEVYPVQRFAFDGCEAEVATEVVGREQLEALTGEWELWKVVRSIDYRYGEEIEGHRLEQLYFAPEIGMVVGSETRDEGRIRGQPFWVEEEAVLVEAPEVAR